MSIKTEKRSISKIGPFIMQRCGGKELHKQDKVKQKQGKGTPQEIFIGKEMLNIRDGEI